MRESTNKEERCILAQGFRFHLAPMPEDLRGGSISWWGHVKKEVPQLKVARKQKRKEGSEVPIPLSTVCPL
jgi:hypothetical protein